MKNDSSYHETNRYVRRTFIHILFSVQCTYISRLRFIALKMFRFFNLVTSVVFPDYSYWLNEYFWHFMRASGDIFWLLPYNSVYCFEDLTEIKIQRKNLEKKDFFHTKKCTKWSFQRQIRLWPLGPTTYKFLVISIQVPVLPEVKTEK